MSKRKEKIGCLGVVGGLILGGIMGLVLGYVLGVDMHETIHEGTRHNTCPVSATLIYLIES